MKKLLSLLSVLTIVGTAVPTTIAASPYQKENSKLNRVKRDTQPQYWQQQYSPAECFYNPIDFNRTVRYNKNGTWEYDNITQSERNCLWQKGIREANFRAQQRIQEWNSYYEKQRIEQQQHNYNQQVKREWEKEQLLKFKNDLIQAEKEGANLTDDLRAAFKMHGPKVIGAGTGALTGVTIGLLCGPGAPVCSAVGSVIGAIVGAISGGVAYEIINRI
ncbi:hypothetical protein [Spiroplasma endosymbiont of Polydrusus pterygomalis]|uniref:hypothetical protein n=1 Tax=Spiroplasma endosymbiont of Polydrusus pterygomalis TaxID=3139327 RepID=UPI003CCAF109